jgi:molecular chaperone GrpE
MTNDDELVAEPESATSDDSVASSNPVPHGDLGDVTAEEIAFEADLERLEIERNEFRALSQRLQADFENYKKRMQREQQAVVERANERLLEELLPALDSFELAHASLDGVDSPEIEKLAKGFALAISQLREVVMRSGLERIDDVGAAFDPNEHEAVLHEDGDGDPVVSAVLRTGYRLKGRVLRPAMVKVSRG